MVGAMMNEDYHLPVAGSLKEEKIDQALASLFKRRVKPKKLITCKPGMIDWKTINLFHQVISCGMNAT